MGTGTRRAGGVGGEGAAVVGVASLNVCCGVRNSLRPVKERAAEFCRRLERADVDVVNFQEVWTPGLLAFLRWRLPSFPFVALKRGVAGRAAGGVVSFSRLPLRSVRYVSFRGTRSSVGGPLFRAAVAVSAGLQGVLTFELSGRRTVVGNVHLTANRDGDWSAGNRHEALQRAQVERVHEALRRARRADTELVIVGGDFNLPSDSVLYEAVVDGGGWRDPFAATDVPTYHPELLPAGAQAHRVDYLLVGGDPERHPATGTGRLFGAPVTMPSGGTALLSDHVAQVVRIVLPPGTPSTARR